MEGTRCENCKFCKKLKLFKRRAKIVSEGHSLCRITANIDIDDDEFSDAFCCTAFVEIPDSEVGEVVAETLADDCCEYFIEK